MSVLKKFVAWVIVGGIVIVAGQALIGYMGWFQPYLPYVKQAPYILTADKAYYAKSYSRNAAGITITDYYTWNGSDWQYYGKSLPFTVKDYPKLSIAAR